MADHLILFYYVLKRDWMVLDLDISVFNISLFRLVNDLGKEHPFLNPAFSFIAEYMVFLLALSVLFIWFTRNTANRIMIFLHRSLSFMPLR
jgi:undecaprenyl-diphosphatase